MAFACLSIKRVCAPLPCLLRLMAAARMFELVREPVSTKADFLGTCMITTVSMLMGVLVELPSRAGARPTSVAGQCKNREGPCECGFGLTSTACHTTAIHARSGSAVTLASQRCRSSTQPTLPLFWNVCAVLHLFKRLSLVIKAGRGCVCTDVLW